MPNINCSFTLFNDQYEFGTYYLYMIFKELFESDIYYSLLTFAFDLSPIFIVHLFQLGSNLSLVLRYERFNSDSFGGQLLDCYYCLYFSPNYIHRAYRGSIGLSFYCLCLLGLWGPYQVVVSLYYFLNNLPYYLLSINKSIISGFSFYT